MQINVDALWFARQTSTYMYCECCINIIVNFIPMQKTNISKFFANLSYSVWSTLKFLQLMRESDKTNRKFFLHVRILIVVDEKTCPNPSTFHVFGKISWIFMKDIIYLKVISQSLIKFIISKLTNLLQFVKIYYLFNMHCKKIYSQIWQRQILLNFFKELENMTNWSNRTEFF